MRALSPWSLLGGLLAGLLGGSAALANPQGPTVVHGTASFGQPVPGTFEVTNSPGAIINWQGFSIGSGEVTRFLQPSAASAVLNRVVGQNPSQLLGQLLSNGRVFLVNPNGIVFGPGSRVDVAGLVASTLDIADEDFIAGRLRFAGSPGGRVENHGYIRAGEGGSVFLIAPGVENGGVIETAGGSLVLAAGRTVTLTSLDLDGVRVEVAAPEDEALNLGALIAERGAVGVFGGTVRNAGLVEASRVGLDAAGNVVFRAAADVTLEAASTVRASGRDGGTVRVESETGTVLASGLVEARGDAGAGGRIDLLGAQVGLLDGAVVDASGAAGGGTVHVGGSREGAGPLPNARAVFVDPGAAVHADALATGDGGEVIVYAGEVANVHGALTARGGGAGGAGGFVETSGRERFHLTRTPDVTGPAGGGEWLIDPNDVTIVAGGGNVNINATNPFLSTNDGASLGIDLITAALSGGQTVTVTTGNGGTNAQAGDIFLNTPLDINATAGTNTLRLRAADDVIINQPVFDSVPGGQVLNLTLDANIDMIGGAAPVFRADVALGPGVLTTTGSFLAIRNGATVTVDGQNDGNSATGRWDNTANIISVGDGGIGGVVVRNQGILDTGGRVFVGQFSAITGLNGSGSFTVASGGVVDIDPIDPFAAFIAGVAAGTAGTVVVDGPGSSITTRGAFAGGNARNIFIAGSSGSATLTVRNGGLVDTGLFLVAQNAAATATIDGPGSRVVASPVNGGLGTNPEMAGFARVGRAAGSAGQMFITNGGAVEVRDGVNPDTMVGTHGPLLHIAREKGSTGAVTVDGAGSRLEVLQSVPAAPGDPDLFAGPAMDLRRGGATLVIRNGGAVRIAGEEPFLRIARDSVFAGAPDPDPGPINQPSRIDITAGGALTVTGTKARVQIGGAGPAANGTVSVSGPGSRLTVNGFDGTINVGEFGTGRLDVTGGGVVDPVFINVGLETGSSGTLTVSGTGSRLLLGGDGLNLGGNLNSAFLTVGHSGTGVATVSAGGAVEITGGSSPFAGFQLGRDAGGTGRLTVSGGRVTVTSPLARADAGLIRVGREGSGTLVVQNGGLVRNAAAGTTVVGQKPGGTGLLEVIGATSLFESGAALVVGEDVEFVNGVLVRGGSGTGGGGAVTTAGGSTVLVGGRIEFGGAVAQEGAAASVNEVLATVQQDPAQAAGAGESVRSAAQAEAEAEEEQARAQEEQEEQEGQEDEEGQEEEEDGEGEEEQAAGEASEEQDEAAEEPVGECPA